jgi:4-amino-4-deoxy-L-arabinose transferase-like glycosyltransferase
MADTERFTLTDFLLLLLVLACAAGARAGYLLACTDGGRSGGPLRVQEAGPPLADFTPSEGMRGYPRPSDLDTLIDNVHHHNWFGNPAPFAPNEEEQTAHASPGYPWLVGLLGRGLDSSLGPGRLDSAVRWIQVALGSLTAGLYFLFARRAFRSLAVATLAGLFASFHPFWVVATATVHDGVLASFLLALALLAGARSSQAGGPFSSLLFGLTLAGLALVRAALLPFAFVSLVWFLLRSRSLTAGWLPALLAFLGFVIGLAPWTVRNYQVPTIGQPIPVVDSAYLHLWVGNNPDATGGPVTERMLHADRDLAADLRKVNSQPERYARLAPRVAEEVRRDPPATVRRRIDAALMFLLGQRWFKDHQLAEVTHEGTMPGWLERSYPLAFPATLLALFALGFLGWRWSHAWRADSMPAALAMVWAPLPYVLAHAEALSGPRLPLDGVLICYAALALVGLLPGVGRRLREGKAAETPDPYGP